ncbi:MAG: ATP-dependent zinc metalloprotease FtsH [Rikenellaceae bacterium]
MFKAEKQKFNPFWVFIIIITIAIFTFNAFGSGGTIQEVTWPTVKNTMLEKGAVSRIVVINNQNVEVHLKESKVAEFKEQARYKNIPLTGAQFEFRIGSLEKFENDFDEIQKGLAENQHVALEFEERKSFFGELFLSTVIPLLLLVAVWMFIFRGAKGGGSGGSNVFSVGKAKAQMFDKNNAVNINFKDVAGLEGAKVEIMEIVDFLKNPKKYSDLGGKIPKGALLVGPPGTGKTLLAKAVAGEANVPFFSMSGSDFVEMFVGVGASRVRDLFRQAKDKTPCIVFIDEIDAIGRARGKNSGFSSNDERENTLNQLLTEMDGFGTNAGVIILAATNRADILDKALLRAGRFDRQIHVDLPDVVEREAIFNVHLKKLKLDPALVVDFLAKQTPGFSGADIANVCNEAALIAARHDKNHVEKQDFLDAIDRIIGGLERKNKIISNTEKRTIAYHEAGHATVSWMLEHANPLIKVTIIPRGKALGAAWYLPEERSIITKDQMLHEMAAILGGRTSEELTFGRISTGALNDLERVTKQAYAMIAYYGMSEEVGNISFFDSSGDSAFTKPYSEKTAEQIDLEVKKLINSAHEMAKTVLTENKDGLEKLAGLLLEREVVFAEDLENIFGKRINNTEDTEAEVITEDEVKDDEASRETEASTVKSEDAPVENNNSDTNN